MVIIKVIKRDGSSVEYDSEKIKIAISKANNEVKEDERVSLAQINNIIKYIESLNKKRILVEDIQDIIEIRLMATGKYELAKKYITYRYTRALIRKANTTDESILSLLKNNNSFGIKNNNASYQRDLIAREVSRDLTKRILLPEKIVKAHEEGLIYFHDMDYFIQPIINSSYINLKDMLENGTYINGVKIEKPKSFQVACNVTMQIINAISGGQIKGFSLDIDCLSPYLNATYLKNVNILKEKYKSKVNDEMIKTLANDLTKNELKNGVQTIHYQINTLINSSGTVPLVTLFLRINKDDLFKNETALIIEEILNQRLEGINKENSKEEYIYPKIVYVLDEDNNLTGGSFDYLTKIVVKCILNNGNINLLSSKKMKEMFNGNVFSPIGENQFLPSYKVSSKYKFVGRFNQGLVSLNLPKVALSLKENEDFFEKLDEALEICKESLLCKYYSLLGTSCETSSIHFRYGALARLDKDEKIDDLLKNGYSTLLLSYVGLPETVEILLKKSIKEEEGETLAIKILNKMNEVCLNLTKEIGVCFKLYSFYDNVSSTYFINKDLEEFGYIKKITDKTSYNSAYFIEDEELNILEKLEYEKKFNNLSLGGTISKVDVSLVKEDELDDLIKYIYENIIYCNLKKNMKRRSKICK